MNIAEEDYLKLVYELSVQRDGEYVKTGDIVTAFGYTTQSVLEMVKKLSDNGLLEYVPYVGVKLTNQGLKEAMRMVRMHRIWEVFLSEKLGLDWSLIHQEAEKLEHVTSEEVINKLYDYIGRPKYCTHGNPIPDEQGHMEKVYYKNITTLQVGDPFEVARVLDHRPLLTFLNEENIKIGDRFTITKIDDFNQVLTIENDHKAVNVSFFVANMIFYRDENME